MSVIIGSMNSVAAGHLVGRRHTEPLELGPVGRLVAIRELVLARALPGGPGDDLVLDVGHVAHVRDVVPTPLEVAADDVEHERGAAVADVRHVVDGRPADVHRHPPGDARDELDVLARHRVVDPDHPDEATGDPLGTRLSSAGSCGSAGHRSSSATAQTAMPSVRPTKPRPSPRFGVTETWTPDSERAGVERAADVRRHRVDVRRQLRRFGGDDDVDVHDPPPLVRDASATSASRPIEDAPRSAGSAPGTACRGRGARSGRAASRRPRGRPRRRRSDRQPGTLEGHPAEHERTVAAERVHVEAEPDPDHRAPSPASSVAHGRGRPAR